MTSRKEIDLIINAAVKGQKNLQVIPKTIGDLEKALDRQVAAAKRGENSIDELKATLLSLKEVGASISGSAGLIGDFKKLSDQIVATEARVEKTSKAYQDYKEKIGDVAKATATQAERLQKMAATQDRATATLARQRSAYAAMEVSLREAGIATDNLAVSERQAHQAAAALGAVIVRNQQAIATYAADVRTARDATKQLDEASSRSSAQLSQFLRQKAAEAADESKSLAELKDAIIKRYAAIDRDTGLQKAADDADTAARKFTSLARASKNLAPQVISVRDALKAIVSPTNEAMQTLSGVEGEISKVAAAVGKIRGPVKDYEDSMTSLRTAQKALASQAGLIDNFSKQVTAMRETRAEFVAARAEVAQYAAKVREGGDAGAAFANALAASQARLRAASEALQQQLNVTRQTRDAMRGAGLATRDLAGEQQRLNAAASASVGAIKQLDAAVEKYGQSAEKTRKGGGIFGGGDGERTTLNFAQRLRGQVLSLTAAFFGLYEVINIAKGALDAMIATDAIESRLAVATESNDPKVIGAEYDYLRGRANYYGVALKELANSYGSYAIAAKSAKFSNEQTRYTFEQLTGGMRVLKLNTDQQSRAWTQLQQILSKTKPEMEDIKTIAESGFAGVQGMMARGLLSIGVAGIRAGTEVADMFKLMKDGALDSGQAIYALAVQAEKELGMRVPIAIRTLQAEQGRFQTATFEFQKAIADSGWADAYTRVLVRLRELMSGEDGEKTAKAIGSAFQSLADILIFVLNHMNELKIVTVALITLWSGRIFLGAVIAGFKALRAQITGTAVAMTALQRLFAVFQAAVVGFAIGTWAYENFAIVRKAGAEMVTGLASGWVIVKHSFMAAFEVLPTFFGNVMKAILNQLTATMRITGTILAKLAGAVGLDKVAQALNEGVSAVTFNLTNVDTVVADRKAQLQRDLAAIQDIRKQMLADIDVAPASTTAAAAAVISGQTDAPGKPASRLGKDDEKAKAAAKKRLADIEEITKAMETLTARSERMQADSLEAQLKAVDLQYQSLSRKIKELGGKEGAEFAKQFASGLASVKEEVTDKFNKKLLAEQEALQKKLEEAEVASGRRSTTNLQARLDAIKTRYEQTYRDIAAYRANLETNARDTAGADAMKDRLDAEVKTLQNLERQKFTYDELTRYEGQMRDLLQSRAATIKSINDLKEGSLITDEESRRRTQEEMDRVQPQLEALAIEAQNFAASLSEGFDPARMQQFMANIMLGVTSMQRLKKEVGLTADQVDEKLATGLVNTFDQAAKGLTQVIAGQKSWSDAIKDTGRFFLQFAADFMREIAMMILKQIALNALRATPWGAGIAALAGIKHSGGVIGGTNERSRAVNPAWFANAPRYHSGGMPGLASDEYATILQRGEEVLAADSPRNIMNGGAGMPGGAGGQSATPQGMRFVFVDDRSKIPEAMASAEGDQVFIEFIRRNASTVRQLVR